MQALLIIGAAEKAKIAGLCAFAAANVHDPEAMKTAAAKDMAAYRKMMAQQSITLPIEYLVTYSHERQPFGVAHHISISVLTPYGMPHPMVVDQILPLFGMQPLAARVAQAVWVEDVSRSEKAINVVQQL